MRISRYQADDDLSVDHDNNNIENKDIDYKDRQKDYKRK